jgi:hypothetical protein
VRSTNYLTGIAIAAAIVIFALAMVAMLLYVIYYYVLRGLLARTTTVPATVIRKHQCEYDTAGSGMYDGDDLVDMAVDKASYSYNFYVLFDAQGTQIEFPVPEHVYADISEGDAGLLTHRGTLFRRFLKEADLPVQTGGRVRIRKV